MFKTVYIILLPLFFFSTKSPAQNPSFSWGANLTGPSPVMILSGTTDNNFNAYTTGSFGGTVDFDPGPATSPLTATSADIFILKLNGSGGLVWVKHMPCSNTGSLGFGWTIGVDPSGNIYIMGRFKGTVDFDPGPAVFNMTKSGITEFDMFITKLDVSGNFVWAKQINSWSIVHKTGLISFDAAGNIFLTGMFEGSVDFDPGPGSLVLTAPNRDIFIVKLDPSGNLLWAKQVSDTQLGAGISIAVDVAGNSYTTGYFAGSADFDPGPGVHILDTTNNGSAFILKLDATGNFIWAKQFAGHLGGCTDIKIGPAGDLFVFGGFQKTVDFDPGPGTVFLTSAGFTDVFVSKFNTSGNLLWVKGCGGPGSDNVISSYLDPFGNIYIAGTFEGTSDFDPSPNLFSLVSVDQYDAFVALLDPSGLFRFAFQIGGIQFDQAVAIRSDGQGNFVTLGTFSNVIDVNPCEGVQNFTSVGSLSTFILDFNAPITISLSISAPTTVIAGQGVIVSSNAINGGTNPAYQWQDSTSTHPWQNIAGATSSSLNYTPIQTGDRLRCMLSSNAPCATPYIISSNVLAFTITPVTAINPVPGSAYNIRHFPNPVHTTLYIDSLKLSDKWQSLSLISQTGARIFMSEAIANKTNIPVDIQRLPAGQYIAVLQRKNGAVAYLKFIKQ